MQTAHIRWLGSATLRRRQVFPQKGFGSIMPEVLSY
jgi:hypothetical protein